jgi:hypothetical protein
VDGSRKMVRTKLWQVYSRERRKRPGDGWSIEDDVPDALVVGDGGERLRRCLAIFVRVTQRLRPAIAVPNLSTARLGALTVVSRLTNFHSLEAISVDFRRIQKAAHGPSLCISHGLT